MPAESLQQELEKNPKNPVTKKRVTFKENSEGEGQTDGPPNI